MSENRSRAELEQEVRGLKEILSVAQVVVSSLELDEVLYDILCSAMGIMDFPAGSIALYDESLGQLTLHAHAGLSEEFVKKNRWRVIPGGLSNSILEEGELFVIEDTRQAEFFKNPIALKEGILSLIAVPLKIQNKIVGILYLDDFVPRQFPENRLRLLSILASFATMSIDNAQYHRETRHLACTDGLTGLYNHRQFKETFKEEVARAERYQKSMSLLMFDIDDFKKFNDTYGHPSGDKALVLVAKILVESLRKFDLSFRYGGEEFMVVLPDTDIEDAVVAAERARVEIAERTSRELGSVCSHGLTVSAGVVSFPRDGKDRIFLLKKVDELLYMAKSHGKNKTYYLGNES